MDLGLLILRVVVGLLIASHGAMKLFGTFGGPGLHGTTGWLHSAGFRPARLWALMGSAAEFVGGLLFALGFLNPLGSVAIAAPMLIAITKVHWPKVWSTEGGYEYPLVMLAVAVAVGIAGPGAFSLDAWLGVLVPPAVALVVIVLAALGYLVGMVTSAAKPSAASPKAGEDQPAASRS
jgi:putative oxidoreductase